MIERRPGPGAESSGREVVRRSRFLHLYRRDEVCCAVHSLTLEIRYGGPALAAVVDRLAVPATHDTVLADLSSRFPVPVVATILAELHSAGMVLIEREGSLSGGGTVPDSAATGTANRDPVATAAPTGGTGGDVAVYQRMLAGAMAQDRVAHMYLIATTDCDLRCRYCFVTDAENRPQPPGTMTLDVAERGLRLFARLARQTPHVSLAFYGGEPLRNPRVVYAAMRFVRQLEREGAFAVPVQMTLITNGALVTGATTRTLAETGCAVSVSIDGPRHMHDAGRVDRHGRPTYHRALAGYRRLQRAGLRPAVSCTISSHNVAHLPEVARFLVGLDPSGVGFNLLLPRLDGTNPTDTDPYYAADQLIEAFRILRTHGVYEDRIMRRLIPYVNRGFHAKDCMGVGGQVVLTPEGRLGPCQAFLGLPGWFPLTIDSPELRDDPTSDNLYTAPLFDQWRHRFPLAMRQCLDCPAIAVCGGGCPYAAHARHGTIWELDDRTCAQATRVLEWMLWDTYDHLPGEHRMPPPGHLRQPVR